MTLGVPEVVLKLVPRWKNSNITSFTFGELENKVFCQVEIEVKDNVNFGVGHKKHMAPAKIEITCEETAVYENKGWYMPVRVFGCCREDIFEDVNLRKKKRK